jgi:hypothetical protein
MNSTASRRSAIARRLAVIAVVTSGVSVVGSPSVLAVDYCKAPYLAQGSSSYVDGTSVTATVNEAADAGSGRYLHQSSMSPPRINTTWTFSPAISKVQFETENHDDATVESYAFTAKDGSGNTVATFTITNVDGFDVQTFGTPVASISVAYSPTTSGTPGGYGSYLYLWLSAGADGVCSTTSPATVRAPSGTMVAGTEPPSLLATAFVSGSNPETPVTFSTDPVCGLEDANGNPVALSSSTPPGTYVVVCTGGTASGYEMSTYLEGEFIVTESAPGEFQAPRDYILRLQALPDTL